MDNCLDLNDLSYGIGAVPNLANPFANAYVFNFIKEM